MGKLLAPTTAVTDLVTYPFHLNFGRTITPLQSFYNYS